MKSLAKIPAIFAATLVLAPLFSSPASANRILTQREFEEQVRSLPHTSVADGLRPVGPAFEAPTGALPCEYCYEASRFQEHPGGDAPTYEDMNKNTDQVREQDQAAEGE